jgi:hypothetical protein
VVRADEIDGDVEAEPVRERADLPQRVSVVRVDCRVRP